MTTIDTTTAPSLPLSPGSWTLDPFHSSVSFSVRHLGVSKVRGRFTAFTAEVTVGETLATTGVVATIDMSSIDTGNPDRDAHVLAADMVDVALRPTITFRSTAVTGEGTDWQVVGELTIGTVTRPVTLAVELGGIETFVADGRRHAGFEATTTIRRKEFGIDIALPPGVSSAMLGDAIKVELDLQLVEPESPTA